MIRTKKNESFLLHQLAKGESKLSIEHVMPQTLNADWVSDLGEDYESIHSQYLHTIPNLTLTGYNSKYSNRSFSEKKTVGNGFNQSPLAVNQVFRNSEKWGLTELEQRSAWWVDQITAIWPIPKSNFAPVQNSDRVELSETVEIKGTRIRKVHVMGDPVQVTTWSETMDVIAERFYDYDPLMMEKVLADEYLSKYINRGDLIVEGPVEIYETGYFVSTGIENNRKRKVMCSLCDLLGIDKSEVSFELSQDKLPKRKNLGEAQTEFWEYFSAALELEQDLPITSFSKVKQQHWMNLRLGSSRAYLSTIIAQNPTKSVGVGLTIRNDKQLFSEIFEQKDKIEEIIGLPLEWRPTPDKKVSRIRVHREGDFLRALEVGEEEYREELIDWMIKYSRIFSDTFSPYL